MGLEAGRELGTWGELRLGLLRRWGDADLRIGAPTLPEGNFDDAGYFLRFSVDTFDNADFPHQGIRSKIGFYDSRTWLGADESFKQLRLRFARAHTWGRHTLLGSDSVSKPGWMAMVPVQDRFFLGGFTKLSGYNPRELSGEHLGITQMLYYFRLTDPLEDIRHPGLSWRLTGAGQRVG